MQLWDSIAIYGVGLIGGSIGMAVRHRKLAKEVVGVGRDSRGLELAQQLGASDRGPLDVASAVAKYDLVIVATPVHKVGEHVAQVRRSFRRECLVTDAGSTKRWIVQQVEAAEQGI